MHYHAECFAQPGAKTTFHKSNQTIASGQIVKISHSVRWITEMSKDYSTVIKLVENLQNQR